MKQICRPGVVGLALNKSVDDLEKAVRVFTNHNSSYVDVEGQDFAVLAEEVLNNSILSLLVFADHSPRIGDFEILSLSRAMQYNVSVEALTLSGINVCDEAISLLCESLVRSRVSYMDFSNTPLEDEAGRSIAALAHSNPYLRTVVVTATLIAEEVQDEIDVACQFNQSNFESNGGKTDETVFREGEAPRLKQRLVQVIRAKERKVVLCVAHLFECCPNDDMCLYSHDLSMTSASGADQGFQQTLEAMFARGGGDWEEALAPLPEAGASWRGQEEGGEGGEGGEAGRTRINMQRRLAFKRRQEEEKRRLEARRRFVQWCVLPTCVLAISASLGTLIWVGMRSSSSSSSSLHRHGRGGGGGG